MRSEAPSPHPTSGSVWLARLAALVLGLGTVALGLLAIDEAGRRLPGDSMTSIAAPLKVMAEGAPVLFGNSVAKSAIDVDHIRNEVRQPTMVDLTLHGAGPTSWFVLFTHHLAVREKPPRVLVLVTSLGWLTRTVPIADRDFSLEISTHDDPALAALLGTTTQTLSWERRFAARLRVRDGLIQLLARPMAARMVSRDLPPMADGPSPIDRAIQMTLGRNLGANIARDGQREVIAGGTQMYPEVEPALAPFLNATNDAGTRVILVVLPQRSEMQVGLAMPDLIASLPRNVQVVDMTQVPFMAADYVDNQHFSQTMHDPLSRAIAYNVGLAWLRKSARLITVTERPFQP